MDGDCSHKTERCLLLGRKAMTNLDSVLKNSDITLLTKVHIAKAIVFWSPHMDLRIRPQRRLNAEELILLNCGVGKDS